MATWGSDNFIKLPTSGTFIYPSEQSIDVLIKDVYPNHSHYFWGEKTLFEIELYSKHWHLNKLLEYPECFTLEDGVLLANSSDNLVIPFWQCKFFNERFDHFNNYQERILICNFEPCPPDEAIKFVKDTFSHNEKVEGDKIKKDPIREIRKAIRGEFNFGR